MDITKVKKRINQNISPKWRHSLEQTLKITFVKIRKNNVAITKQILLLIFVLRLFDFFCFRVISAKLFLMKYSFQLLLFYELPVSETGKPIHLYFKKMILNGQRRHFFWHPEAVVRRCSIKKVLLRNLCQRLFFNKVAGLRPTTLLKNETLAQVFSFEFCKISKTFSYRTPPVAPSGHQ